MHQNEGAMASGDALVAGKLDRLGRDLRYLINTGHDLNGRGVGLKVLTGHGAALNNRRRQASFRHLCGAGRVRARVDCGAHRGRLSFSAGLGPQRRTSLQDARCQAASGYGYDGTTGNQGRRSMSGARHYTADPVPAYLAEGGNVF